MSILLISPVVDLDRSDDPVSLLKGSGMQVYNSFSGCRNHSALHGEMGYSLICFRSPDPTLSQKQNKTKPFTKKKPGGVGQGVGPEFKPHHCKKKKNVRPELQGEMHKSSVVVGDFDMLLSIIDRPRRNYDYFSSLYFGFNILPFF
jgi:hypothetical protein